MVILIFFNSEEMMNIEGIQSELHLCLYQCKKKMLIFLNEGRAPRGKEPRVHEGCMQSCWVLFSLVGPVLCGVSGT